MAIIVVSTQMGAGGPEIGMALGQKCGFRYVDQELLQDAGRRYGLAEERLSHLDESKPTIFERFDAETRHHITVLQTTLLELAELDNAIFMRGGGQWPGRAPPPRGKGAGATTPEAARYGIRGEAGEGAVRLGGPAALDGAAGGARGVRGVKDAGTRRLEIPPIPPFVA